MDKLFEVDVTFRTPTVYNSTGYSEFRRIFITETVILEDGKILTCKKEGYTDLVIKGVMSLCVDGKVWK